MTVWNQYVTQLSGYSSHRGLAVVKKPIEPAAFIIHLINPGNTLLCFYFSSIMHYSLHRSNNKIQCNYN